MISACRTPFAIRHRVCLRFAVSRLTSNLMSCRWSPMALISRHGSFSCLQRQVDRFVCSFVLKYGVAVWRVTNWVSTESDPCDTVDGCINGDATERRSAYAEATAGQVHCLNTPTCMKMKPRPPASAKKRRRHDVAEVALYIIRR